MNGGGHPAQPLGFGSASIPDQILPMDVGGTTPYTYSFDPPLPSGVNFNQNTRRLGGIVMVTVDTTAHTYIVTDNDDNTAWLATMPDMNGAGGALDEEDAQILYYTDRFETLLRANPALDNASRLLPDP